MTEMTPLARKLWDARNYAGGSHVKAWNNVAKVAEAELASVAESATVRPIRLPTVEEVREAIIAAERDGGWIEHTVARAVLDLVASLNQTWVPVPADATIPAGTLVRVEEPGTARATEFEWRPKDQVLAEDRATENFAYFVPSGTVLEFTPDPRIEAAARAIYTADQQDGDEQCWDTDTDAIRDTYVRLAKAAADALGVTL